LAADSRYTSKLSRCSRRYLLPLPFLLFLLEVCHSLSKAFLTPREKVLDVEEDVDTWDVSEQLLHDFENHSMNLSSSVTRRRWSKKKIMLASSWHDVVIRVQTSFPGAIAAVWVRILALERVSTSSQRGV
jgi:hypothetical protein